MFPEKAVSETPASDEVVEDQEARHSLARRFLGRRRLIFFGAVLAVELTMFFFSLVYPIDPAQQQALMDQANSVIGSTTGQTATGVFSAISGNNLRVALLEMVPVVGVLLFAFSIFTTGQIIQALALSQGLPGPLFGAALFFFPFAILELSAYAVAVASGTMLLVAWRKKTLHWELRIFAMEAVVVIVAILVAAGMETLGIVSPFYSFALWLPTGLGLTALVVFLRGGSG